MPKQGDRCYLPLGNNLPSAVEDMINNIKEESDDDAEIWHPNATSIPTTKLDFQMFDTKPEWMIIIQQHSHEVIRNYALGPCPNYVRRVVANNTVAWLLDHNHIVDPPAVAC